MGKSLMYCNNKKNNVRNIHELERTSNIYIEEQNVSLSRIHFFDPWTHVHIEHQSMIGNDETLILLLLYILR